MSAPTARATDHVTAHEAAAVAAKKAPAHRIIALLAHADAMFTGLTDFELAERTGIAQTSIGVRRKRLVVDGLVKPMDIPQLGGLIKRPSPTGTPSQVWTITLHGLYAARLERERRAA